MVKQAKDAQSRNVLLLPIMFHVPPAVQCTDLADFVPPQISQVCLTEKKKTLTLAKALPAETVTVISERSSLFKLGHCHGFHSVRHYGLH